MTQTGEPHPPDPPTGASRAPAGSYLPPLLRRAWFGLNQAFRRRLAPTGLTPDQFTVLRLLEEAGRPGATQRVLVERMVSDPNTIASLLERMQRAGLVTRRPDTRDRRANRVRLTAAGRERFQAGREIAQALHEEVMSALGEQEREQFLEQLGRVAAAAQSALTGAARERRPG